MNTSDLKNQIDRAVEHERRTHRLRSLLQQHMERDSAEQIVGLVETYVYTAPALMDALYTQAQRHTGLAQSFQPFFDIMFNYWAQEHDLIPDSTGLLGLTDDAYLTMRFVQTLQEEVLRRGGDRVVGEPIEGGNKLVRQLMGDAIGARLDAMVTQSIQQQQTIGAVNQLVHGMLNGQLAGMFPLTTGQAMQNYYRNQKMMRDIDHQVNVQLGAMGIF